MNQKLRDIFDGLTLLFVIIVIALLAGILATSFTNSRRCPEPTGYGESTTATDTTIELHP